MHTHDTLRSALLFAFHDDPPSCEASNITNISFRLQQAYEARPQPQHLPSGVQISRSRFEDTPYWSVYDQRLQ